jgi:capsular polysaccharide biosynthesis protein
VRRVTNESETMDLLSGYGFERYRLADLSYAEQVTLFSGAEAIVSPHGSGLLNQIWTDDATVIELFGPKHSITDPAIEYYTADLWGHDYGCVQCEAVGNDTRVDLEGLEILLERMLD